MRAGTLWAVVVIACTDDAADPSGGGPDAGNPIVLDAAAPDAGTGSPDAGFADLGAPADAGAGPCAVADIRYELGLRYARVPGVDPNLLSLDLALPVQAAECPAPPLVVYVHGGGWRTGDKRGANVGAAVQAFVSAGYAFATVNYRLSPAEFSNDPNRVMYPTHNQDVATAIAWLIEQADEYGYRSSRIRLYGFSAGAGIVSAVATNERFLREVGRDLTDIGCVASLDTEGYDVARQAETEGLGGLYRNAFGDDPAVWAEASPINHLAPGKGIPPFLIVVRGTLSRIQLSREFADGLYAAGADARVLETTDFVHEDVGRSVGEAEDLRITPAILSLFDDCRFSADPAALRALETLTYRWSFRPGRDPNDRPTHATEVNALVAHAGRLFATIGVRNLIQPDGVPATGPQVLVKDGPDAPWRVEQTFGPAYVRSESMAELVITTDGAGDALSPPVRLLVAGVGQTEPPSSTVWTRDDAAGTWTRIVLDADPRRTGGAVAPGVRSLVVHRDPETGVDAVYAGTSAGRLFRGVYDAAAPGRLRFDTAPELTDRPGRVHSLATVDGALYASAEVDNDVEGGGLFRRANGPDDAFAQPADRFSREYVWTNPDPTTGLGLRAITEMRTPGRPSPWILGAREQPGVIERVIPAQGHTVQLELDVARYFLRQWGALAGSAIPIAYNDFASFTHPDSGDRVRLAGVWVDHPEGDRPPHNGAYFLIRASDGTYRHARIQVDAEPVPAGRALRGTRTIAVSPFSAHAGRVIFFGGFDAADGLHADTAWIIEGRLED